MTKNVLEPIYSILFDYGSEGLTLHDEEYPTVDGAVKAALSLNRGVQFKIIQIIDWNAE